MSTPQGPDALHSSSSTPKAHAAEHATFVSQAAAAGPPPPPPPQQFEQIQQQRPPALSPHDEDKVLAPRPSGRCGRPTCGLSGSMLLSPAVVAYLCPLAVAIDCGAACRAPYYSGPDTNGFKGRGGGGGGKKKRKKAAAAAAAAAGFVDVYGKGVRTQPHVEAQHLLQMSCRPSCDRCQCMLFRLRLASHPGPLQLADPTLRGCTDCRPAPPSSCITSRVLSGCLMCRTCCCGCWARVPTPAGALSR